MKNVLLKFFIFYFFFTFSQLEKNALLLSSTFKNSYSSSFSQGNTCRFLATIVNSEARKCKATNYTSKKKKQKSFRIIINVLKNAYKRAKKEQDIEDINKLFSSEDNICRYFIVLPLSNNFQPPPGHFSYNHVMYGDKISVPKSILHKLLKMKADFPWQFSLEKVERKEEEIGAERKEEEIGAERKEEEIEAERKEEEIEAEKKDVQKEQKSNVKRVFCSVLDFRAPENFIFIPPWIMESMNISSFEIIRCELVKLPKGGNIKLYSKNSSFFKLKNHAQLLERELRHYSSLTKNTVIRIRIDSIDYLFRVIFLSLEDNLNDLEAVCIQDSDVNVNFVSSYKPEAQRNENDLASKMQI